MSLNTKDINNLKAAFFDEADILFSLWDKELICIDVNEATLKAINFKRENFVGKHVTAISPDTQSSGRLEHYKEVIRTGNTFVIDEMKVHPSLGNFYARIKAFKVGEGLGIVTKNITDLKQSIEKLQTQKNLFEGLLESAPDGIVGINEKDQIVIFNRMAEMIFGYERKETMGSSLSMLMPEKNVSRHKEFVTAYFANPSHRQMGTVGRPLFGKRKNGELFPVDISLSCFETPEGKITLSSIRDITKQKLAEEKLTKAETEIRNFARHINKVLEDERAHIAREIHDDIGQQLAGIKMGLALLKKKPARATLLPMGGDGGGLEASLDGMMRDVDNTIQSLRKIATELRPGILDSLGLIPSIKWLAQEFEKKTGIKCFIETDAKEQMFEKNLSTCFFRICQESLTNISKHAQASEIRIKIRQAPPQPSPIGRETVRSKVLPDGEDLGGALVLEISDNGKGISSEKLDNPFSMGLLGMRERANIIGADLKINTGKGKGTTVLLRKEIAN